MNSSMSETAFGELRYDPLEMHWEARCAVSGARTLASIDTEDPEEAAKLFCAWGWRCRLALDGTLRWYNCNRTLAR